MKPSRVGRRAVRGGRHAVRAVARRPIPVAVVGLAAATVLGLGALTAADIHDMDQFGSPQFGSHQRGPHPGHGDRQFDQHFGQIPNFRPPGN